MNPDPDDRAARLRGLRSNRAGAEGRAEVEAMLVAQFGSDDKWTTILPSDAVTVRSDISASYSTGRSSSGYFRTEFTDVDECLTSARRYLEKSSAETHWFVRFEEAAILGLWSMSTATLGAALPKFVDFDREAVMLVAQDFRRGCLIDISGSPGAQIYTFESWDI